MRSGIRVVHKFEGIVAQMLEFETVGLISFIIKRIQFVDGKLVKLVEIRPPFVAVAEIVAQVRVTVMPLACRYGIISSASAFIQ